MENCDSNLFVNDWVEPDRQTHTSDTSDPSEFSTYNDFDEIYLNITENMATKIILYNSDSDTTSILYFSSDEEESKEEEEKQEETEERKHMRIVLQNIRESREFLRKNPIEEIKKKDSTIPL